ncbi:helix-turn-helix domain-containing protein [Yersinia enterocolitica]|uniref:helix-turn-helix domain-containing protein n=1 Tax=Yersinia enterocolitica TaxID=630 RepID=UPI003AB312B7
MNKESIVLSIIERIESKLEKKENIKVDEVANISGYTKRYTQKIFKEQINMNISSYIKKRRLSLAAIIIKLTKKSFYHIAMDFHFSTQQSFTRAFSREFNLTPSNFRKSEYFDYSNLLPNRAMKLTHYEIRKTRINDLNLCVDNYTYQVGLLNDDLTRSNKIRLSEVKKILANKEEIVIVTTFTPTSKYEDILQLQAKIGFKDNVKFNYKINGMFCWEISYSGEWSEYIKFGRFFIFELEFSAPTFFIEEIHSSKRELHDDFYDVKIYIPAVG